ncbi:hypothetical protein [Ferrimonas balearica]|uniref:hypothetical protein n=1 Tax=Ferrimonas balearica TaxID=44012 RepID=UPI001C9A06C7|nr:hypothetical protein [Ferrimonas balearica]MBY5990959.1 hypothetical protein [Ferrimonas balearica]
MADASLRRLTATALLGWALCLSLLSSHALAETLHHLDGSDPCAQALIIDHWLHALPGTAVELPATAAPQAPRQTEPHQPVLRPVTKVGIRDPPALPLS